MNNKSYRQLPLVYACSGCSSAAQLANTLAVRLDREELAEMSCVAGVGGDVKALVKVAKSERRKIVLDGCPLHCALNCLKRHGVEPDLHLDLSREGVRKVMHADTSAAEEKRIWNTVLVPRVAALTSR
ncbi:Uncharacterized protein, contains metal-binding DGC domain [Microbulbifer donghaiensis]|uniref:Uncharacterized protein, contains metal-binding DGC domain n=1 Tax=Microbulbifer donghaiensis TaxID=494016 RepID=A0A1M4YSM6_9GAMM|nr:putative zinc-binding protein [Microbulbifer donghaiensis]SHF08784.1 Uncharacterized protein, contains metal-binding DGC domain [Microbulbifer donghaiensis]